MRVLLIRELEARSDEDSYFYSIETPTKEIYRFSENGEKNNPKIGEGQSANIDLTIYNKKFVRTHLLEFKFGNKDTCTKDFLKLLCDDKQCKTNYYINILETFNKSTRDSVEEKYGEAIKYVEKNYQDNIVSDLVIIVGVLYTKHSESDFFIYETINKNQKTIVIREEINTLLND